jgi:hypothetical protein
MKTPVEAPACHVEAFNMAAAPLLNGCNVTLALGMTE